MPSGQMKRTERRSACRAARIKRYNRVLTIGAHFKRHPGDLLQIVLSTCCDLAKEDLLGDTASERHAHAVGQLLRRVQVAFLGQVLCVT